MSMQGSDEKVGYSRNINKKSAGGKLLGLRST
jgi:hypothetical protein